MRLAHIEEQATQWWSPMAYYFRERTGIDPLTIDQTVLGARSAPAYEHPRRRIAEAAGLLDDARPVILIDNEGRWLQSGDPLHGSVDVHVLAPPIVYADGVPTWLTMGGRRVATTVQVSECETTFCVVEVVDPRLPGDASPLDRVEATGRRQVPVYVTSGQRLQVRVLDADGHEIRAFPLTRGGS